MIFNYKQNLKIITCNTLINDYWVMSILSYIEFGLHNMDWLEIWPKYGTFKINCRRLV